MIVGSALVGTASGVIDAGLNAYVAEHLGVRALNGLHACFGIGATLGPLLVTGLLHADASWRVAYVLLCAFEAGARRIAFFATRGSGARALRRRPRPRIGRPGSSWSGCWCSSSTSGSRRARASGRTACSPRSAACRRLPRESGWACTGAASRPDVCLPGSSPTGSGPHAVLNASMTGTVLGTALLWWSPAPVVGAVGLAITGLGLAAIFPTLIGITPVRLGVERARSAIGYQVAAAALGARPPAQPRRRARGRWSLEVVGPLLVLATGVMIVLHAAAQRMAARLSAPPPALRFSERSAWPGPRRSFRGTGWRALSRGRCSSAGSRTPRS